MSTIALCIPAYNASWCLPRLLQSALNQKIPFDEILVYNDCSTDDTAKIAEKYGAKVINGSINRGCSFGKNELAKIAKSTWLHFHDADDDILPNFNVLVHKWIKRTYCPDVVLFNYEYRDNLNNHLLGVREFNNVELENDPLKYTISEQINPFCGLYNKKSFLDSGGYDCDPLVLFNEDCAMHISLALHGLTFGSEQEVSIINYYVQNSMSQDNQYKCAIARYHVLEKTSKVIEKQYSKDLIAQLYNCIALLSVYQNWDYVKRALNLCKELGQPYSTSGNPIFNFFTQLNPFAAVWFREKMIRIFKPHLRSA